MMVTTNHQLGIDDIAKKTTNETPLGSFIVHFHKSAGWERNFNWSQNSAEKPDKLSQRAEMQPEEAHHTDLLELSAEGHSHWS